MKRILIPALALLSLPLQANVLLLDPTAPPLQPSSRASTQVARSGIEQLRLQQILYRSNHRQVVINGKALAEGDAIQGFRVWRIEPQRVGLERDGERQWLDLYAGITRDSVKQ